MFSTELIRDLDAAIEHCEDRMLDLSRPRVSSPEPVLPQLQILEKNRSAHWFLEDVLSPMIARRAARFRELGGRIGILAGEEQWLIDLELCMVTGGGPFPAIAEASDVDVVVRFERSIFDDATIVSGSRERLDAFVQILSEGP